MKKFFVFLFLFAIIFSTFGCKQKDDINKLSANLTSYEIKLNLDCETKTADVNQTIKYVNNTNSILKFIKLHLYPQFFEQGATEYVVSKTHMNIAYPNGLSYADFNINRVRVGKTDVDIVYENEFDSILVVELNSSLMPNETESVHIDYSFVLPNCYHRFGYGDNTINLANFYPIICSFDSGEFNTNGYNSNGDPFYSDMANYCVDIILNRQYIVAGTGIKENEKIEDGLKKVSFNAKLVRDFAMVVSDKFEVINSQADNTIVEYYHFNDEHKNKSLQAGIDAIKTFSKLFGEYPYETYSIVQSDFVYGGMEFPNLVMINSQIENQNDYLNVIIHETAHQWWYGIVGNNEFEFPWLDEALTEFSTILFYDNNKSYDLTHKQIINSSKENYSLFINVYEDVLGPIDTSMKAINQYSTEPEYVYCTYVKGVLMYESLYHLVGEKDFIKSLKFYFEKYKYKNVKPENLIYAFEKVCNKKLENFFSSWIQGKVVIK